MLAILIAIVRIVVLMYIYNNNINSTINNNITGAFKQLRINNDEQNLSKMLKLKSR